MKLLKLTIFIFAIKNILGECNQDLFKQLFGETDENNIKADFLVEPIQKPKYLKSFCPVVASTCCSENMVQRLTQQFKQAYSLSKIPRDQMHELETQIKKTIQNQRFFEIILQEKDHFQEFKTCLNDYQEIDQKINYMEYFENIKKNQSMVKDLFEKIRNQIINYYGGTLCGLCDESQKEFIYSYEYEGYTYINIQFDLDSKNKMIDFLQNFNNYQFILYQIVQISKVGYCFNQNLKHEIDIEDFKILQNAGQNNKEIHEGLEQCRTVDTLPSFLGRENVDCYTILSFNTPFVDNTYFIAFSRSYPSVMKGLKFIEMNKNLEVSTLFKNSSGQTIDWTSIDQTLYFLKRSADLPGLYQVFDQKGMNPIKENFNKDAIKDLIYKDRPISFNEVMHKMKFFI